MQDVVARKMMKKPAAVQDVFAVDDNEEAWCKILLLVDDDYNLVAKQDIVASR